MLTNTRTAIAKMIDEIKSFSYHFNIVMQVMYFAYLLYAIGTERGILWLNIALAGLSILYFVFYVATYNKQESAVKKCSDTGRKKMYLPYRECLKNFLPCMKRRSRFFL